MRIQLTTVKNNLVNRAFLWYLKKVLNRKDLTIVLKGRHSDRKSLYAKNNWHYKTARCGIENNVPWRKAETIGVYIVGKRK